MWGRLLNKVMLFSGVLVFAFLVVQAQGVAAASIQLEIDGEIRQADPAPEIRNGSVFVPLRFIFEYFGADVVWNSESQEINVYSAETTINMKLGSDRLQVNGKATKILAAPYVLKGSTMVPLRLISETLGAEVGWMSEHKRVVINSLSGSHTSPESAGEPDLSSLYPLITRNHLIAGRLNHESIGVDSTYAEVVQYFGESEESEQYGGSIVIKYDPFVLFIAYSDINDIHVNFYEPQPDSKLLSIGLITKDSGLNKHMLDEELGQVSEVMEIDMDGEIYAGYVIGDHYLLAVLSEDKITVNSLQLYGYKSGI